MFFNNKKVTDVIIWKKVFTKRVLLSPKITEKQIQNICDEKIKTIVKERLSNTEGSNFGEKVKKAFANLDTNPIYLNKEKNICIKAVSIILNDKFFPIRSINSNGNIVYNDFVISGNNHHALVYLNGNQKVNIKLFSFRDAVENDLINYSIKGKLTSAISREDSETLGKFLYSIQINDLFIFNLKHNPNPTEANELDFFSNDSRDQLSKKLFRIQTISITESGTVDIRFRHHLETNTDAKNSVSPLKGVTWDRIRSNQNLMEITKVRINHLGEIIKIGE